MLAGMSKVRVHNFSISLDGFGTGEPQTREEPFGHAGERLHEWAFPTHTFTTMFGKEGGSHGVDEAMARRRNEGVGAEIMGRKKFGPQTGPWTDDEWRGWWGDNPPFHTPVFVMTHHPRESFEMEGGTTFHFVDAPVEEVLAMAKEAAGERDVRIGGVVSTVRQFLEAGLIDLMHLALVPNELGRRDRILDAMERLEELYDIEAVSTPSRVTHLTFTRRAQ